MRDSYLILYAGLCMTNAFIAWAAWRRFGRRSLRVSIVSYMVWLALYVWEGLITDAPLFRLHLDTPPIDHSYAYYYAQIYLSVLFSICVYAIFPVLCYFDRRTPRTPSPVAPIGGLGGSSVLRFTGKERDSETGLDYFGARCFSSAQARFTSPDWSGPHFNVGLRVMPETEQFQAPSPIVRTRSRARIREDFMWTKALENPKAVEMFDPKPSNG